MAGKHNFGDTEHYRAKKEIKERFNKLLTDLQKTVERNGYAAQTVRRFRGCLEVREEQDVSSLPFYARSVFSPKRSKVSCVLHFLSSTVQTYWKFCTTDYNTDLYQRLNAGISSLENIASKGLAKFKLAQVRGYNHYYLEEV